MSEEDNSMPATEGKVIFFDNGCLLCSSVVKWTHARDRAGEMWFAALDSQFAERVRSELKLPPAGEGAETFAYWNRASGKVAFRSEGALALANDLGGIWAVLGFLGKLVPRVLRDAVYRLIARNRRRWFGEVDGCALPAASLRGRVLA